MTIKVGDRLPEGTLSEFIEVEGDGCTIGPNQFKVGDLDERPEGRDLRAAGRIHADVLGEARTELRATPRRAQGEGRRRGHLHVGQRRVRHGRVGTRSEERGKVRMMGDGSAEYTKALGLELDLNARGMGTRCQRFSMLVDNGVVKTLNIEAPGKYEVSGAETMLKQLG